MEHAPRAELVVIEGAGARRHEPPRGVRRLRGGGEGAGGVSGGRSAHVDVEPENVAGGGRAPGCRAPARPSPHSRRGSRGWPSRPRWRSRARRSAAASTRLPSRRTPRRRPGPRRRGRRRGDVAHRVASSPSIPPRVMTVTIRRVPTIRGMTTPSPVQSSLPARRPRCSTDRGGLGRAAGALEEPPRRSERAAVSVVVARWPAPSPGPRSATSLATTWRLTRRDRVGSTVASTGCGRTAGRGSGYVRRLGPREPGVPAARCEGSAEAAGRIGEQDEAERCAQLPGPARPRASSGVLIGRASAAFLIRASPPCRPHPPPEPLEQVGGSAREPLGGRSTWKRVASGPT